MWEGAAPRGASVTLGMALRADCDAAWGGAHGRGVPSAAAWRLGVRVARTAGPGPGRPGWVGVGRARAAPLFLPRSFRSLAASAAGKRQPGRGDGPQRSETWRAAFTFVSHKSHRGTWKPREGRIA